MRIQSRLRPRPECRSYWRTTFAERELYCGATYDEYPIDRMTPKVAAAENTNRASLWQAQELRPSVLVNSLTTGLLVYGVGIMPVLAFAALVFSGPLGTQLSVGLGFALLGSAILCGVTALLSSYPGSIAIAQDAPAVLLSIMALSIITTLPRAPAQTQVASIVLMLTVAAVVSGLVLLLLGAFKLAVLVRYLPFPVMGGFLAGTGWLLAAGGIGVMMGGVSASELAQPGIVLHWLPGALLGLIMLVLVSRVNNALMFADCFGGGTRGVLSGGIADWHTAGRPGAGGLAARPLPIRAAVGIDLDSSHPPRKCRVVSGN